jgi:hypothetical protein
MTGQKFLHLLAEQFVSELRPNESIRNFTTNSDVIGAYAEASLRQFITRVVSPLRVCMGAVVSEQLCSEPHKVPQIDAIVWSPSPAPAIFNVGDFGLVPRSSCFGIMEIKRSAYSGVGTKMAESLKEDRVYNLVADVAKNITVRQEGNEKAYFSIYPGIGVICVKEDNKSDSALDDLIQKGLVVILFDGTTGQLKPNTEAVHRLINFLILTRLRARVMDGLDLVNVPLLSIGDSEITATAKRET